MENRKNLIPNPREVTTFTLPSIGSSQLGYISYVEALASVPVEIKRVFWTYFTPQNVARGGHAHKELTQIVFAVAGRIQFNVETKDGQKTVVELTEPNQGLYLPPGTWSDIHFSHSAVLVCLASEHYIESDYIRSYADYLKYCGR